MFLYIFTFVFIVGGCEIMDENKNISDTKLNETLPNTAAFQDPFTREFMVSSEEVEEGFFLFKSGTNGFTMLFPVNARISRSFYERVENHDEAINVFEKNHETKTQYTIRLQYFDEESTSWIDSYLELTSSYNGYEGKYEKYKMNNNTIFYAEDVKQISEEQNGTGLFFFAFIKSNNSNQAIIYSYFSLCQKGESNCVLDEKTEREFAKKIMHSIRFEK